MQLHTHSQPRKIIQTSDVIVILYEANGGVRQIFMDGRPAPSADAQPWWAGYSRGRWEGRPWSWKRQTSGTTGGSTSTAHR